MANPIPKLDIPASHIDGLMIAAHAVHRYYEVQLAAFKYANALRTLKMEYEK